MDFRKIGGFFCGAAGTATLAFGSLCYGFNSSPGKTWSYGSAAFSKAQWAAYFSRGGSFNHRYTLCDSLVASIRPRGLTRDQIEASLGEEMTGALNTARLSRPKTYFDDAPPSQEQSVSAYLIGSEMNVMFGVDKIHLSFIFVDNRCTACFIGGNPV